MTENFYYIQEFNKYCELWLDCVGLSPYHNKEYAKKAFIQLKNVWKITKPNIKIRLIRRKIVTEDFEIKV